MCLKQVFKSKSQSDVYVYKGTVNYIYSDLWELAHIASLGETRYLLSLIDDFSRMVWVYMLKVKDDVFE